jgi:hypothetical protein
VRALSTVALLFAFLLCGCRQLEMPPDSSPVAVAPTSGSSIVPELPPTAQAVAVYRIAADDVGIVTPVDVSPPVDCTILPPRAPDQFVADARGGVASNVGDAGGFLADIPGAPSEAIAVPSSDGGANDDFLPRGRLGQILATTWDDALHDYGNFYSRRTAIELVAILAPAAVLANTDLDYRFGNWYQTDVRSAQTNRAAAFFMPLGNGYYTIPVYLSAKFIGEYFDDVPGMSILGEWGDRTTRALLVGAPPLLAAQYFLGGGRPSEIDKSYWRPFHSSHGASGHAFMGAVPFITLAQMTDDPFAKCFFYACSPWTGMARINDNLHYLSQVWVGWWLAYLACDSVNRTEIQKGAITLSPLVSPEMTGVGVMYAH